MTRRSRGRIGHALVTTGVVAVLTTGCAPSAEPEPLTTPHPTFSTEEEALAAAEELIHEYRVASNVTFQNGGQGVERLRPLVTESHYEEAADAAALFLEHDLRQQGRIATDSTRVVDYGQDFIQLTTCNDYSDYIVVNGDGFLIDLADSRTRAPVDARLVVVDSTLKVDTYLKRESGEC